MVLDHTPPKKPEEPQPEHVDASVKIRSDEEQIAQHGEPDESGKSINAESGLPNVPNHQIGGETERKAEQKALRTKATQIMKQIDLFRNSDEDSADPDEFAWVIQSAEDILDELLKLRLRTEEPAHSHHIESLRKSVFMGRRCLNRWDDNIKSKTQAGMTRSPAAVQQPSTAPLLLHSIRPSAKAPELPKFGGDASCEWPKFWGLYSAAVDNNPHLTATEKLTNLLPLLKGIAADAVAGFAVDGANYDKIVAVLKSRFDRRDRRKDELLERFLEFPNLEGKNETDLRKHVDKILATIRELETFENNPQDCDSTRLRIERILPKVWKDRWIRRKKRSSHSLQDLTEFLAEEMEIKEEASASSSKTSSPVSASAPVPFPRRSITSGLTVSTTNKTIKCSLCARPQFHTLNHCPIFLRKTPEERNNIVKEKRLCFNCLGPHRIDRCTSAFTCMKCNGKHHTLICFTNPGSQRQHDSPHRDQPQKSNHTQSFSRGPPVQNVSNTPPKSAYVVQTETPAPTPTTPSSSNQNDPGVATGGAQIQLLSTGTIASNIYVMSATCTIIGPLGTRVVRILFDSGSDASFIRKDVSEVLGLQVVSTGFFACVGIMGKAEPRKMYQKVQCGLLSHRDQTVQDCQLWILEKICAPLKPRAMPDNPILQNVFLADDLRAGPVDIIIGTDLHYNFILGPQLQLSPSLRAFDTVLGWVLHGKGEGEIDYLTQQISTVSFCLASLEPESKPFVSMWELEGIGISPEPEESAIKPRPKWNEEEGKIEVGLLWKNDERPLPNYNQASKRVQIMTKRLNQDQKEQYDNFISSKLSEKVIQPSPVEWIEKQNQFFLPHRGIYEGKFRVVFDGSSVDGVGKTLNSYMVAGPNLLPKLNAVLFRFRVQPIGFQGDIKGAFHQISLPIEDRPFVQFLYDEKLYHFCRVPFGLICSPSLLHSAIDFLLSRAPETDLIQTLRDALYFDDLAAGFTTQEEAKIGSKYAQEIFAKGGMELHKIRITGDEVSPAKLLGLLWDTRNDCLSIIIPRSNVPTTKKELLSVTSKIWDPLGVISPWVLQGKLIFQETWSKNIGWNEKLPGDLTSRLKPWIEETKTFDIITFDRVCSTSPYSIDCFVDASFKATCAAVYLVDSDGKRHLLTAKTRLAPIQKSLSIPRLELVAALIGTRLVAFVLESLPKTECPIQVRYFSDSQDVLYWLRESKPTKVFVQNRVKEILKTSHINQWYYIQTDKNPADLGTRPGVSLADLSTNMFWWNGPILPKDEIPTPFVVSTPPATAIEEEKVSEISVCVQHADPIREKIAPFDLEDNSNLSSVIHRTAWILRFVRNCRLKEEDREKSRNLKSEELIKARNLWIRIEQEHAFDLNHPSKDLKPLNPFIQNNLLYSKPRTGENPVLILPKTSRLTYLIILDAHKKCFHQGVSAVASLLSADYHVSRRKIKDTISSCRPCRRFRGLRFRGAEGMLPSPRVEFTRCFARVGIDFFGPLYVKDVKVYCLIFVCYTSRAIHLEVCESQNIESTTFAIRKFCALRGNPIEILSDNAKTFKLLAKTVENITWKTIPERTPWWGGMYERIIGIVKSCLRVSLRHKHLNLTELQVCMYELSFFINLRPLTKFKDEVLTPSMFLYGVPSTISLMNPVILESPTEHWRMRKAALLELKRKFLNDYLSTLRNWRNHSRIIRTPEVGDLVLVHDQGPRTMWKIARVENLIVGTDGKPRAAHIKIGNLLTRRGLERLFHLEGEIDNSNPFVTQPIQDESVDDDNPTTTTSDQPNPIIIPVPPNVVIDAPTTPDNSPPSSPIERKTRHGREVRKPARYFD